MITKLRDPVSGLSHGLGVILSLLGTAVLVYLAATRATGWHVLSFSVFGASLLLLYTASSLYHSLPLTEKSIALLRRVDHCMIYVLIAGTYTPICLVPLRDTWGWPMLIAIWSLALLGMVLKLVWFDAPRWLYTLFYVLMGWAAVVVVVPLFKTVPIGGIIWLLAGGLMYSIGALIYGTQWPKIPASDWFGFHEMFHLFVLAGSFCHYWMMYKYILNI
ncbi:MAG: PAQR family membrane homeostasis protein TrhA [Ignavibacteriales bacterium]